MVSVPKKESIMNFATSTFYDGTGPEVGLIKIVFDLIECFYLTHKHLKSLSPLLLYAQRPEQELCREHLAVFLSPLCSPMPKFR